MRLLRLSQVPEALSPLERVFEHWVFMLGKAPGRVALGPQRRRAIERALDFVPGGDAAARRGGPRVVGLARGRQTIGAGRSMTWC